MQTLNPSRENPALCPENGEQTQLCQREELAKISILFHPFKNFAFSYMWGSYVCLPSSQTPFVLNPYRNIYPIASSLRPPFLLFFISDKFLQQIFLLLDMRNEKSRKGYEGICKGWEGESVVCECAS